MEKLIQDKVWPLWRRNVFDELRQRSEDISYKNCYKGLGYLCIFVYRKSCVIRIVKIWFYKILTLNRLFSRDGSYKVNSNYTSGIKVIVSKTQRPLYINNLILVSWINVKLYYINPRYHFKVKISRVVYL